MADNKLSEAIIKCMNSINFTDTRQQHKVVYPLVPSLLAISLAYIAGKNTAVDIADYWTFNLDRLRSIIPGLPATPISHDTVLRLLKSIRFDEFDGFILNLTQNIIQAQGLNTGKKIMSLDGQTPRAIEYTPKEGMKHPEDGRCYNRLYYVSLYDSMNTSAAVTLIAVIEDGFYCFFDSGIFIRFMHCRILVIKRAFRKF